MSGTERVCFRSIKETACVTYIIYDYHNPSGFVTIRITNTATNLVVINYVVPRYFISPKTKWGEVPKCCGDLLLHDKCKGCDMLQRINSEMNQTISQILHTNQRDYATSTIHAHKNSSNTSNMCNGHGQQTVHININIKPRFDVQKRPARGLPGLIAKPRPPPPPKPRPPRPPSLPPPRP